MRTGSFGVLSVKDQTIGDRAQITLPSEALSSGANLRIDVLESPLLANSTGYSIPGSYFVPIGLDQDLHKHPGKGKLRHDETWTNHWNGCAAPADCHARVFTRNW
jgi:hypothetical protein